MCVCEEKSMENNNNELTRRISRKKCVKGHRNQRKIDNERNNESDNISKSRITQRLGLYALGKISSNIKRDDFRKLDDEYQARARQDLDVLVQLMSKGSQSSPIIIENSEEKVVQPEPVEFNQHLFSKEAEEELLKMSVNILTKDMETELEAILEPQDKNVVVEIKEYLRGVYQQRKSSGDCSQLLFSEDADSSSTYLSAEEDDFVEPSEMSLDSTNYFTPNFEVPKEVLSAPKVPEVIEFSFSPHVESFSPENNSVTALPRQMSPSFSNSTNIEASFSNFSHFISPRHRLSPIWLLRK